MRILVHLVQYCAVAGMCYFIGQTEYVNNMQQVTESLEAMDDADDDDSGGYNYVTPTVLSTLLILI